MDKISALRQLADTQISTAWFVTSDSPNSAFRTPRNTVTAYQRQSENGPISHAHHPLWHADAPKVSQRKAKEIEETRFFNTGMATLQTL